MKHRATVLALTLVAACGDPTIEEYEPRTGIITGTVLYRSLVEPAEPNPCVPTPARGNVIVTLFAEDRLPPPQGTSGPVGFIVVPADAFFPSGSADDGLFAAPFTMPTVSAGRYQLRAFLDADGDFNPTIPLLAQVTAGDVGGGYVDDDGEFRIVEVENDRATQQVTISVGRAVPFERPAFAITSTATFEVPYATPQRLVLSAHPIQTTDVNMIPECTRFLVQYADLDGDGEPDDVNGDHLPDLFPQVLLRRIVPADPTESIIIPGIIDPLPFRDALAVVPGVPTDTLEVLLPPVAIRQTASGRELLDSVPPGTYETIVISGTGQTWSVPNDLALVQPADPVDSTQTQTVVMAPGAPLPTGGISGRVQVVSEEEGTVYVVAFSAANPGPPEGTGTPVGIATIPNEALMAAGAGVREAPFTIRGLPDGTYVLVAILDANGDFSPLVPLVAQPNAGDVLGAGTAPITVSGGIAEGAVVQIGQSLPFDRPAFSFDEDIAIPRTSLPTSIRLDAHDIAALGIEDAVFPVSLAGEDADGDNLPDLRPRVLLTRMGPGDPRTAPSSSPLTIIPGIVNPIPFLATLAGGTPVVPATSLEIILPPIALVANAAGGFDRVSPPPEGRYRVNVLSATGQTWSVPSDLDIALGRVGGPLEDPTQARFVSIVGPPGGGDVPGGAITGRVTLAVAPPEEDFSVIVFAFASNDPPPPDGSGRPRAITVVPKAAFDTSNTAPYALGGLTTGMYQVRAFLDADDDFVPWFDTLNQPDAGDVGGGHLDPGVGALIDVSVDALGAPVQDVGVTIIPALAYPTDRPAFALSPPDARLDPSTGSVTVTLDALVANTDILMQEGVFVVRWIDRDRNGQADDINGDTNPDVYPIVLAQQLDETDETNQTLVPDGVQIPGIVNPGQFPGFPAGDPTQVQATVLAESVSVVFPAVGVRPSNPTQQVSPPEGRYRVTVISPSGQTWSTPNELVDAAGTALPMTQGRYLTVRD